MPIHVIILAAGEGKRMKSGLPKVAHTAAGRALVSHVIETAQSLDPVSITVVVGHRADQVRTLLPEDVSDVLQAEQLGTGHATQIGLDHLGAVDHDDIVLILYGDTPLVTTGLLGELTALAPGETARLVSSRPDDPTGYGRVIRDEAGNWHQIEAYVSSRSDARFSHGVCPACAAKHYGDILNKKPKDPAESAPVSPSK